MTTPTTITTTKTRVIEIESVMIIEFFSSLSSQRREDFERLYYSYAIRYITLLHNKQNDDSRYQNFYNLI